MFFARHHRRGSLQSGLFRLSRRNSRRVDYSFFLFLAPAFPQKFLLKSVIKMDPSFNQQYQETGPRPHPYLHEPLLYITNLPPYVSDENLAMAFVGCGPFRPKIQRDSTPNLLSGIIEFKFLDKGDLQILHCFRVFPAKY